MKPKLRLPRLSPSRLGHPVKKDSGFSLLEVLIALAVLAILGTVTLRGVHQGQDILFADDWRDTAALEGRNLLYEMELAAKSPAGSGTFAPRHPALRWRISSRDFLNGNGSVQVLEIYEKQGTLLYELKLESFNAVYEILDGVK